MLHSLGGSNYTVTRLGTGSTNGRGIMSVSSVADRLYNQHRDSPALRHQPLRTMDARCLRSEKRVLRLFLFVTLRDIEAPGSTVPERLVIPFQPSAVAQQMIMMLMASALAPKHLQFMQRTTPNSTIIATNGVAVCSILQYDEPPSPF